MSMIECLKVIYHRQMFFPSWFGVFVNPFFFARTGLRDAIAEFAPSLKGRLLDVGCGSKPYRTLFHVDEYVGLDIDGEHTRQRGVADYLYEGKVFPFADNSFDSMLCNQVLEHVFNPENFIAEIVRVLKPGGHLLLTAPFVWDEHEQPNDYARYSSFGIDALLGKHGMVIIEHKKLGADASVIFQLVNIYICKITDAWPNFLKHLLTVTVIAILNIIGLAFSRLLPANPDLFLDHAVLAEKAS